MHALLKVGLGYLHFCDNPLQTDKFVGKSAAKSSWSDKICAQIALDLDIVVLNLYNCFLLEARLLLLLFKVLFNHNIIFARVSNYFLRYVRMLCSQFVYVQSIVLWVRDILSG